jgi:LacI family transcriptional regulator
MTASPQRVLLRDIAEKAGVTRMAVSLALRGKPGVSEDTRAHILNIARELGYSPDPEVAKLLARIRSRTPAEATSCLALLTSGTTADQWKKFRTERMYVEGAIERAKEYGYRMETFWLGQPGLSPARLSNILWNRGIEGVIIAPWQGRLARNTPHHVDLDFDRFSVVEISETIDAPDLDRAMHDQYTAMIKCLDELAKLGYRRIGLVLEQALDLRVKGRWTAAYLRYRDQYGSDAMPPPLLLPFFEVATFNAWIERHVPDAIVSVDCFGMRLLEAIRRTVPDAIGYASLDVDGDNRTHPGLSGIDQHSTQVGASAVDLLVSAIHRGQRGIPANPVRIAVEGSWHAGNSTCPQTPETRRSKRKS